MGKRRHNLFLRVLIFVALAMDASPGKPTAATALTPEPMNTLYVDGSKGSDSNPGTSARPKKTISNAAQIALHNYSNGISTSVVILPGTYRERIGLGIPQGSTLGASISLSAAQPGTVVISGADVWNGWSRDAQNSQFYVHGLSSESGPCQIPNHWPATMPAIVRRREIVSVNGTRLTQVLSRDQMRDSTFLVDDQNSSIVLQLPTAIEMSSAQVEVAVRPRLLETHHISKLKINGLSFVNAASCPQEAAVMIFASTDDLIENNSFQGNNWSGLLLTNVLDSTVRGNLASHNGSAGFQSYKLRDVIYQDIVASFNGWRVQQGAFFGWDEGGVKILLAHGSQFKNIKSFSNQGPGFWFDTDNRDVTISDSYLSGNTLAGAKLEANQGPITIENSRICNNQQDGVFALNSDRVTLKGNIIAGNSGGQIFIDGRVITRSNKDWESNQPYSATGHNLTITANTIAGTDPSQLLFRTSQAAIESSVGFFSTLTSDSNTWSSPGAGRALQYDAGGIGHAPHGLTLEEWRSRVHQDPNSVFSSTSQIPAQACANP